MRKFLVLILLLIFLVNDSFSSPLVFKVVKEIESTDLVELGNFDATKYRQIRVGIKAISTSEKVDESKYAQLTQKRAEFTAKLQSLRTQYKEINPQIIEARNEIDRIDDEITELNKLKSATTLNINILGVEGKDEILLFNLEGKDMNRSIIIDSPSSRISIKASGKATYSIYVWGQ